MELFISHPSTLVQKSKLQILVDSTVTSYAGVFFLSDKVEFDVNFSLNGEYLIGLYLSRKWNSVCRPSKCGFLGEFWLQLPKWFFRKQKQQKQNQGTNLRMRIFDRVSHFLDDIFRDAKWTDPYKPNWTLKSISRLLTNW